MVARSANRAVCCSVYAGGQDDRRAHRGGAQPALAVAWARLGQRPTDAGAQPSRRVRRWPRLRTRSTMARRALASEMRTNALLSSSPSRLRRNSTIELSAGFSANPAGSSCAASRRRRVLVEELHRHAEHLRQIEQPAGADAVDALLVLLDLLEGQAELLAELLLAHAEQHAAEAHPAADMHVDRIGPPRALLARPLASSSKLGCVSTCQPRKHCRCSTRLQLVGADVHGVNLGTPLKRNPIG